MRGRRARLGCVGAPSRAVRGRAGLRRSGEGRGRGNGLEAVWRPRPRVRAGSFGAARRLSAVLGRLSGSAKSARVLHPLCCGEFRAGGAAPPLNGSRL